MCVYLLVQTYIIYSLSKTPLLGSLPNVEAQSDGGFPERIVSPQRAKKAALGSSHMVLLPELCMTKQKALVSLLANMQSLSLISYWHPLKPSSPLLFPILSYPSLQQHLLHAKKKNLD